MDMSDILETIWYFLGRGYRNPRRGFGAAVLLLTISAAGFWGLNRTIDNLSAVWVIVGWVILALMLVFGAITLIGVVIRVTVNAIKLLVR